MTAFKQFRHKSNGVIASYPEDYINHPVYGSDLELWEDVADEYEEDKVVFEDHELPVEQRSQIVTQPIEVSAEADDEDDEIEDND